MVMPSTYVPKFCAAAVSAAAAVYHATGAARSHSRSPAFHAWQAVFFAGGSASAMTGAVLEAAFDDLDHGVAWSGMLIGVEVAAFGAWASGIVLLATGSRFERALIRRGVLCGIVLFLISIAAVLVAPRAQRFDLSFNLALPGGLVLLGGSTTMTCRYPAHWAACSLMWAGILITGIGYVIDIAWLEGACAGTVTAGVASTAELHKCPLPAGITPDCVYHTSLALSYLLIGAAGAAHAATPLKRRRAQPSAAVAPTRGSAAGSVRTRPLLDASCAVASRSGDDEHEPASHEPCPRAAAVAALVLTWTHRMVVWTMTSVPPARSKPLRIKHAINLHKLLCAPVVASWMMYYRCRTAHAYAAHAHAMDMHMDMHMPP